MIPLTNLYDEYNDWPKLTEQKNPFEYIVPPFPLKWGSEQPAEKKETRRLAQELQNKQIKLKTRNPKNILSNITWYSGKGGYGVGAESG